MTPPAFAIGDHITSTPATGIVSRAYRSYHPSGVGPQWCYEIDRPEDGRRIICVYEDTDHVRLTLNHDNTEVSYAGR